MEEHLHILLDKVYNEKNIDFRGYKKSSLKRRIGRRIEVTRSTSVGEYLRILESTPGEYDELIDTLLIRETAFFRDPEVFGELRETVFPEILSSKEEGDAIRVWCAGCATGEEAYSVAMVLAEDFSQYLDKLQLKLYATDLTGRALKAARRGEYSEEKLEALPEDMLSKYFSGGKVKEELRRMVIFGRHNLVSDPPISSLDLLLCRHVLIYLISDFQRKVFALLHYALRKGGFLVLGKSEAVPREMDPLFEAANLDLKIYRKL